MTRYLPRLWFAWVIMGLVSSAAVSAAPREIRVVRPEGNWPPYEMTIDGTLTGLHIELVRAAAKMLNLSVRFEGLPWKRAIQMLKDGHADAITFMSRTEERERFGYFFAGNILSTPPVGLAILKSNRHEIHFAGDLEALRSYTIGTIQGYVYQEAFDRASWLNKDDGAANDKQLLRKLKAGRFKIAAAYVHDLNYRAKIMGIADDIVFLRPYLSAGQPNYLVFAKAKDHEALARLFADGLTGFKDTTGYRELLERFAIRE